MKFKLFSVFLMFQMLILPAVLCRKSSNQANIIKRIFKNFSPPSKLRKLQEFSQIVPEKLGREVIRNKTKDITGRVVLGMFAEPDQFPFVGLTITYMSGINTGNYTLCSCSLVSILYVLYAAHCLDFYFSASQFFFGSTDSLKFPMFRNGIKYTIHPLYDSKSNSNDIALAQLLTPVTLSINVQIAKLPSRFLSYTNFQDKTLTAVGFGLDEFGNLPENLKYTELQGQSDLQCSLEFPLNPNLICAESEEAIGICVGDSGGPLMYNNFLVGVNNLMIIKNPQYPNETTVCDKKRNAFTRVDKYLNWITGYTKTQISWF